MRTPCTLYGLAVLGAALTSQAAAARPQYRYLAPHPIAAKYGGGYCYIEAPHFHAYAPDHPTLYQQVGEQRVFTGDPTPFGYEGERHKFYGHHPVLSVSGEPVYCYIDGPHYHAFEAQGPDYKVEGDVAFYVGTFGPDYARLRPQRAPVVNAEYRPFVAFRPAVEVRPPPEWRGEVWVAPPAVGVVTPAGAVQARGPGAAVQVETPSVGIHVALPGVGVQMGGPGVMVGAPGVFLGPGPQRGPHRGEEMHEEREHWDHGKHKGWDKHDHH
jgi:hypothetical protein